ncbi:hypothetical protein AAT19DRAFT_14416 [Rhodotorula toruloides]|uniref:WHIM1 domain-containing protein n=1 Tax=Rhodotorula toruloides TaxID=5286 RepID=A0A2T0ABL2_RHOTO|nr:hypothetical protein AAT19DRAFT_14416 [Rhodotorula toruloides]
MAPAASASTSAKASPAPAAPKAKEAPVDPEELMKDASMADLEDEVTEGPAANWEVAYVWAFVHRFTSLVDFEEQTPVMPDVMSFEQALLDCSPAPPPRTSLRKNKKPLTAVSFRAAANGNGKKRADSPADSLSSVTDSDEDDDELKAARDAVMNARADAVDPVPPVLPEDTPVPPSSQIVRDILDVFIDNLSDLKELTDYHGKKTWFHFLINFVTNRFNADPYWRGGLRWQTNLLRTRGKKPGQENEKNFWLLRWEDKIHLMRVMVDFQLTSTPKIREMIKENYDLGNQRIAKRDPDSNGLVILPIGRTLSHVTLYHIDSSPRIYASGNPYTDNTPWIAVSSTLAGYKAFLKTLSAPTKADRKMQALRGPFAKAAHLVGRKAKGKGAPEKEDKKREERITRARLEADLPEILEYQEVTWKPSKTASAAPKSASPPATPVSLASSPASAPASQPAPPASALATPPASTTTRIRRERARQTSTRRTTKRDRDGGRGGAGMLMTRTTRARPDPRRGTV